MSNPVTDGITEWADDANTTDSNTPAGASSMSPGGATELAGELRRIKSEVRGESVNKGWERWKGLYGTLNFIDATHFSLSGNQFTTNGGPVEITRRIKVTQTSGTAYCVIVDASFGAGVTTVTVIGTALDAGLSEVQFGVPVVGAASSYAVPGVRVYNSASPSIATSTITAITYDTVRYNNFGTHLFDGGTPSRLKYPFAFAGMVFLWGEANWSANTTGDRAVAIALNGDFTNTIVADRRPAAGGSGIIAQHVSTDWIAQPGDYFEMVVFQSSGGALTVARNANSSPEFSLRFITARP